MQHQSSLIPAFGAVLQSQLELRGKSHLHRRDWKQPGGFVGQSCPKFTNTAECSQAPPRAAPACRERQSSCSFSAKTCCCLSLTHACFFTETGVSDVCYDDNCAVGWWSSAFLD